MTEISGPSATSVGSSAETSRQRATSFVFGSMWPSAGSSRWVSVPAPEVGGFDTSMTVGPSASAVVSSSSARAAAWLTVTGWLKRTPVSNDDSTVGDPNVAQSAAIVTGTDADQEARRRDQGEQLPAHHSAHASPAIRTIPSPFWPAPSSPVRDSDQPGP